MKKMALVLILVFLGTVAYSATAAKIGGWLKTGKETGFKFIKEIDSSIWQAQVKLKDWKYSWNVYVQISQNESHPDLSIVNIFTIVTAMKEKPSQSLMAYILRKNEETASWGCYSVQVVDSDWEIHYLVKLRQNSLESEPLINAVVFVAGYANKVYTDIENYDK
jgi:hypothetical protein